MRRCRPASGLLSALLLSTVASAAWAQTDSLAAGFADPPQSARPRVWWHWMNGNITKDGITKDLEWMKRVGIGGLQNFDASLATPQVVDKRLVYMTPEWKDAFRFAAGKADELGLELAIAASPGWSETGGPWVPPQDGMKKLVWSETVVAGGKRFAGKLAPPPSVTGPFQTVKMNDPLAGVTGGHREPPRHYQDVAVIAYPAAAGSLPLPQVRSGAQSIDTRALFDGDAATDISIARGTRERPASLDLNYAAPQTIRSASLFVPGEVSPFTGATFTPVLEARVGAEWRKLAELPIAAVPTTVSFAPVTASAFRIVFAPFTGAPRIGLGEGAPGATVFDFFKPPAADAPLKIAEIALSAEAKVDRFEQKAGFAIVPDYYGLSAGVPEAVGVPAARVVDLTGRMKADGSLDWTPPSGNWRIVRLGWSLTGTTNHPAPEEATGLEVDKLDGAAVRRYLETYLRNYKDAATPGLVGARGVRALLTDSTEVGPFNWTPRMAEQFRRLRGYDVTPWLPALTGAIIGSRADSDKFLYDFRRTIADLHAAEHYGTVAAVAHENGLQVYGEALEDVRPTLGDDMTMRKFTDVPMAALWTWTRDSIPRPTLIGDMKGASSVAHIYGQNVVAAESMTAANAPWAFAPSDLRRIIDLEFAYGVNRPVIHTSVHQPLDKAPGLTLAIFGQYFNRLDSWADMAKPWVDYLARNGFMLQQGRNFADVAYFYGEEAPLTALFAQAVPADLPVRYAYDFVNPDVLLNLLSVDNGELVAKSGARYKLLQLGGSSQRMTLPVLRRIATLAEAGATVVGKAPTGSPSLGEDAAEYRALVARLWSGQPATVVGKGRVVAATDAEAGLAALGIAPDFDFARPAPDSELLFLHRRLSDGDAYFVTNRKARAERFEARFRVTGKTPEIWRADTGTSEPVSYRTEGGVTVVPLELAADDSLFVVFRKPAAAPALTVRRAEPVALASLDGPWTVAFQTGRGAPASATLASLGSLSEQANPGVRYFSGIATYSRAFTLPRGVRAGGPLWLDLGKVGDLAEVRVNGQLAGTAWHAPYRLDIGRWTRAGANRLEIRVANVWVNRLIGDAQPGAAKIGSTPAPTYRPDAPLRPAGLIGPVTLLAAKD